MKLTVLINLLVFPYAFSEDEKDELYTRQHLCETTRTPMQDKKLTVREKLVTGPAWPYLASMNVYIRKHLVPHG